MADGLRVGPVHHADTAGDVEQAAREWLAVHRPGCGVDTTDALHYRIHVRPARHGGDWEARIEAAWTPTPQRKGVAS